jgi:hypothetical protein
MTHRSDILKDWLGFSELDGTGAADTKAIRQAVGTLIAVMGRHEDASSWPICRTARRRALAARAGGRQADQDPLSAPIPKHRWRAIHRD